MGKMEINGKVHCFFEQSGTFKNEFKKLGIEAEDYDVKNNFGETDHVIDLFSEIEKAYYGGVSILDAIHNDDLIMAFFPCIYFEAMQANYYQMKCGNLYCKNRREQYDIVIRRIKKREYYYTVLYKLFAVCEQRGLRMILENPATQPHYLMHPANFIPYTFIDHNRMLRGDYFVKPNAYWFVNCERTYGFTEQKDKKKKLIRNCKKSAKAGICSEERSMISPDYARNFICDFILGIEQQPKQPTLFDL